MNNRGKFIVFEGGDGVGKSTQATLLARRIDATSTREPGGTALGQQLRAILLDPEAIQLDSRTEALLMAADRAQHVSEFIEPALAAGQHVVCDRYVYSSVAYQGWGRQLGATDVANISWWAAHDLRPDAVVFLDVPEVVAATRLGADLDRFEQLDQLFRDRVREGYQQLLEANRDTWVAFDGERSPDELHENIFSTLEERLGPLL